MENNTLVLSKLDNKVLTLTLNRPELHNAFNAALITTLTQKLKDADNDAGVRVVVLTANGKNFCAGADLNWMRETVSYSYAENIADAEALAELMHTLYNLSKPTIAIVQGAAYGGGVGLIACCDIALASEAATFCFSEVKLGLAPAVISPYIINAIGMRAAHYYFLTAEILNADEAYRLGLIQKIVATDLLATTSNELIQKIVKNSPKALSSTKKLLHQFSKTIINKENTNATIECTAALRVSAEGQEGLNAFLEKRMPTWLE